MTLLHILQGGGRAESKSNKGIDFGFGDNAIFVHTKNVRDERNEREPYSSLPEEMRAQVI